jgi:endoglucanase
MKKFAKKSVGVLLFMVLAIATAFSYTKVNSKASTTTKPDDVKIKLVPGNSWADQGNTYLQVDVTITNDSRVSVNNWIVTLPVNAKADVTNSWNIKYDLKNATLTITGVDSNKTISAGNSTTFGIVLMNAGDFDPDKAELSVNNNSTNPDDNNPPPTTKPIPQPTTDDWLFTDGSQIVDKNGKEVWLTGVNWFGYNTGTNIFDGVWSCDLNSTIAAIADRGFNLLRIPFSSELILDWKKGTYPKPCYNDYVNDYLKDMNSLEIFDYIVDQCRASGIKIMIDIHSAETNAAGHFAPLWYTENISEADYLDSLSWMSNRYKNDDTIIAYDLKNEPHGAVGDTTRAIWNDSTDSNNWKYMAERASNAVLSKNPNALVMVEGIQIYPTDLSTNSDYSSNDKNDYYNTWWGGNLRGVKDYPVNIGKYQNKLVYSPHDYGPTVSDQPWFQGNYTMESLYQDCWKDNWMYIQKDNIAPLLIGEWGGFMTSPNIKWMTYFRDFIIKNKINHTFWCLNANSGDTGGLLYSDFTTWDEDKYEFVKEALWQKSGKFIGLDQEIPLGTNGISLSAY